ncbi:response regulator transcription factor [Parapusillimonas granuli]|uniref:Response regulator transcription factor n=1 Tax=Parapusillimonas granuli TaxID=380911 RepID=A0A853G5H5_9BURK|nr:response regulator transcription factor [Parapusillimonas granuli]MBB5214323.1 DNA-binding NarL/FixJ family response regulator [Parapusillimonas granuli]MEB2399136.1 response regulator transcription factor [Alcaligenaceae bacterium]NYT51427.1 response regulator transcription factor [Parapusillimonas granuli]
MTTIIVIEPHPLLRLGILQLLSDGSCSCTLEGADYSLLARETSVQRNCDLILLSISSFEDLHDLAHAADRICSPKSILLLSDSSNMPHSVQGLPASVAGYVAKNAPPEVLQASVKLVLAGGSCFPMRPTDTGAQASLPLIKNFEPVKWPPKSERHNKAANGNNPECEMLGLTPRQYEVLVLLARGYPMKTVGRYLNISVATAKAHTETLYQRLDVHNRNAAVYAAVSRGATLGWPSIQNAPHDT